jgi:hypothetical protein
MTLRKDEITAGIKGFGLLLCGDPAGAACYDLSRRGLWLSFVASLAAMLLFVLVARPIGGERAIWDDNLSGYALKNAAGLLFAWLPSLAVQGLVARLFGSAERYAGYAMAFNWSQVVVLLAFLPLILASLGGWLPTGIPFWVEALVIAIVLVFVFNAARIVLGISRVGAMLMALVDLVLSKTLLAMVDDVARGLT